MTRHIRENSFMMRGTTVLAVRHKGKSVLAGDGQVTISDTVLKHNARKVRRIYNEKILVGFAGATADAFHLYERFEKKLEQYNGNLVRSSVELAKDWRTDKYLRRLEALMLAMDRQNIFLLSGNGDVIEPDEGIMGIGSGGAIAQAAAIALSRHSGLNAREIAIASMEVTSSICIYTNSNITIEEL